mgnify:CR=1 FL=1
MNESLLDEPLKAHLSLEWERFRKALAQAGDIGPVNFEDWRIMGERDRKNLYRIAVGLMILGAVLFFSILATKPVGSAEAQ